MEVSLVSKRGVPDDAIISIRSGAVRRQGAVSTDKPFRFPQNLSETDCVVKVDIMRNIGTGYLVLRPNQREGKQYEVALGGDSEMACELAVKPADGDSPSAEAQADLAAAAKTKQDAKAYLESTGLLAFVQGVLQVVAKQQPQDPFAAMAKHFLSASDEAEAPTPGSPKAAPASPKAAPEDTANPEAEACKKESMGDAPPQSEQEAEKAESEHVDDHKSDTLEEFTSTVRGATLPAVDAVEEAKADEEQAKEGSGAAGEGEAKVAEVPANVSAETKDEPAAEGEGATEEAAKEESNVAAEEAKSPMDEAAEDGAGAAAPEARGEAAQAEAAETAATGADEKKETAEEPKEVAE